MCIKGKKLISDRCQATGNRAGFRLRPWLVGIITLWMLVACDLDKHPLENYHIAWDTQSVNASESMPCGGGDIGLNVWVENGDVLFYIARSGTFDENNTLLKLGRVRLRFSPNPFTGKGFSQELVLEDGYVSLKGEDNGVKAELKIWVDVHRPVIHAGMTCSQEVMSEVIYENWRHEDLVLRERESLENSWKWAPPEGLIKRKDSISFARNGILFYHRNTVPTIFDVTVQQQGLDAVKDNMYDPLRNLTFGGLLRGNSLEPAGMEKGKYQDTDFLGWKMKSREPLKDHSLEIILHTDQVEQTAEWLDGLMKAASESVEMGEQAYHKTVQWWNDYWDRSFIYINKEDPDTGSSAWQVGRNYQLFRYMLGCNAFGEWPTRFNGGLFTTDPSYTRDEWKFTPDFRNWGGGTFTAQNQRLVYFPMLKSGDFEMMYPQFDFYQRTLKNAELRSRTYWDHGGACFTEQIENFGLPNCSEYGWSRPQGMDPGIQDNRWLEYQWDTALEFCQMILEMEKYTGKDISEYLSLIRSCLDFFDEHYRFLARKSGGEEYDSSGNLVLYPGSACETYKMAMNASPTVAGLQQVLKGLLNLPERYLEKAERTKWREMLNRIPPIPTREIEDHTVIAPAESWERVQNTELPQLYPVYPWRIYGVGKEGLETAINTWKYDPDVEAFRDHVSWKQYNIFAACLGLTGEAAAESIKKLQDSGRRFPAFWGPGFDWVPDHNWGGSGMIGLQEMLLQTSDKQILLFPAWPAEWDVHFRLHAPGNTVVEARLNDGVIEELTVSPEARRQDVNIMLTRNL